ncbi:MAG: hypothetical protein EA415_13260 [Sphaerobacteraceae bacterium]|nr:MAG: hypothetical protein EA415_13260 [Sphaerobacteraceae bacterium]
MISSEASTSGKHASTSQILSWWFAQADRFAYRELAVIGGLSILAILSGASAKAADESGLNWASGLGDHPAMWVLALALIGWLAPSPGRAAIRAVIYFVVMCLAYYAWAAFVLNFPVAYDIWFWIGLAATAVPLFAAVLRWTRDQHGILPGFILATVAALAVIDGVVWQLWWAWVENGAPDGFPLRPFQAVVNIAVALTIAGVFPRDHRTRVWALLLLIPIAILLSRVLPYVLDSLFEVIGRIV